MKVQMILLHDPTDIPQPDRYCQLANYRSCVVISKNGDLLQRGSWHKFCQHRRQACQKVPAEETTAVHQLLDTIRIL